MRKQLLSLVFISCNLLLTANKKDSLRFSLSTGVNLSTINTEKDFVTRPRAGLNIRAGSYLTKSVFLSGEFTYFKKHDATIFIKDIRSNAYELNAHFLSNLVGYSTRFYFITGMAVQTRKNNIVAYDATKPVLVQVSSIPEKSIYYGMNLGFGFSQAFNRINLFADFKYRMSTTAINVPINIIDIGYQMGLRFDITYHKGKNQKRLKLPGDKYHWF